LLNTIARTGTVLGLFTAETPEWGVTEVATTLGVPTSTTFDLLASLAEIGLLQQTMDDRYRLGWQLLVIRRRLITPWAHRRPEGDAGVVSGHRVDRRRTFERA
jgi:DNA-binding IclR family transcriptional regulator